MRSPLKAVPLVQDDAQLLGSRGVIRLTGDCAEQVAGRMFGIAPSAKQPATYAVLERLDRTILADAFLVRHADGLLIDCDRRHVKRFLEAAKVQGKGLAFAVHDESRQWRVFALLGQQAFVDDGFEAVRYIDPRRHELGRRVLRSSRAPRSDEWRDEAVWRGHALRLGFPSRAEVFTRQRLTKDQANLHLVDSASSLAPSMHDGAGGQRATAQGERRILPFRVEPSGSSVPWLIGSPILCNRVAVGRVLDFQGLFGVALVKISAWRASTGTGDPLTCLGEQVVVTVPRWMPAGAL